MGDDQEFIIANSIPIPESGCWLWMRAWSAKGYGAVSRDGLNYAHRLAYQAFIGPIPDGTLVCHKCDVRACVNPAHLFNGTSMDNSADARRKGRMHPGERNYNNKLTDALVVEIRDSSLSAREWARRTGIARSTICMARRRETWVHV